MSPDAAPALENQGQAGSVGIDQTEGTSDLTEAAAKALTMNIKATADRLVELIEAAFKGRAWVALDYSSWDAYCTAEFGGLKLARADRQELVAGLRESGMSIRAIASATGSGTKTIQRDLSSGVVDDHTSATPPAPVKGTDGKIYPPHRTVGGGTLPPPTEDEPVQVGAALSFGWALCEISDRIWEMVNSDEMLAEETSRKALQDALTYAALRLAPALTICTSAASSETPVVPDAT